MPRFIVSDFSTFATVGVLFVGGVSAAATAAARSFAERKRARRALKQRPVLGTLLTEGTVVRVTGVVREHEATAVAPLSGRRCVVYRSRIKPSWLALMGKTASHEQLESFVLKPFVVDRGAQGEVLVDSEHALLDLAPIQLPADRARREHFVVLHGKKALAARTASFEEIVVEPGGLVSVVGMMMLDPAEAPPRDESGFRDAAPPRPRLTGNRDHPLVIGPG